ncbi:MAG: ASKHA domain-containing protein [Deltaproteobacteria bacterium]|nr:ASKHA domain-containing protein [Deltaproteobacteria bacterium]
MTRRPARPAFRVPPDVAADRLLLDLLRDAGFILPAVCGGRGTCGACAVRVEPPSQPTAADGRFFSKEQIRAGYRLACLARPDAGMAVFLPHRRERGEARAAAAAIGPATGEVGLAVDAGTTTVACALVSLRGGRILAEAAVPNGQAAFGADVISRIEYASRGREELARLRDALAGSVRAAATAALRAVRIPERSLSGGAVAGNPTMIHLLVGADPVPLGRAPFRLAFTGPARFPAAALGFPGDGDAPVSILPLAGVTLGGDVIGGAVALGMDRSRGPRLLLDVGTNAEMVLAAPRPGARGGEGRRGRPAAWAASAASGGAFEGGSISCGMRAGRGAITGVAWEEGDIRLRVEGGGPPAGLAGSGLVALVALLRRFGVLDESGRMRSREELFGAAPPGIAGRVIAGRDGERAFLLARVPGSERLLTASDVRRFQLAKGAIRAGLEILLAEAGIDPEDLATVHLAGAFGGGLGEEGAVVTGLLPAAFRGKLDRAGNASLMAASEAARTPGFLARSARFARRLEILNLADHPAFPSRFLAAMEFPPRS